MDVFEELVRLRNLGQKCALATIVEVRGSIPSYESAKLLVREGKTGRKRVEENGSGRKTRKTRKPGTDGTFPHSQRWPNPKACRLASTSDFAGRPPLSGARRRRRVLSKPAGVRKSAGHEKKVGREPSEQ